MEKNLAAISAQNDSRLDLPLPDQRIHANSTPSPLRSWLSVVAVAIGAFAFVTTEFLPVGLLPQIARDLGVSPGTAGLMVTTPGVIAAISAPALMLGAGRINRRLILLALSVLLLASNLVSAMAPGFGTMLLGRALLGAALGGFWTLALATSARLVQEQHAAKATAMILTGVTFATVIGVPLGTFISTMASWRASFIATGVLAAVALAAQALLLPSLPSKAAIRLSDLRALLSRANTRKSLLMVALVFGAHFSAYTYVTPFLVQSAGFNLPAITSVLLGFGFVGFVSNFVISTTVSRNLQLSLFAVVAILMVSLLALPSLHASQAGVVVMILAWGVAFGAIPLCLSIWLQMSSPDLPEAGSALFVSIVQVAIAVGSSTGGVVVDSLGIPSTLWLGGALALAGLVVISSFGFNHKKLGEILSQ
ncbi:Predicted arabinose efflux permease, MFS family [Collimonas sp. OK607]|uniref:MFS transporter n=1 Tax=Collimonas sp. OK607 TaxID=1798194 RepID=UPI0008EA8248|nr:MFS transporter [Collimonas sp. OK607]SFB05546.1 Predicted arabinose efflux permease, MFS family [Collimonas sp. OK607]